MIDEIMRANTHVYSHIRQGRSIALKAATQHVR